MPWTATIWRGAALACLLAAPLPGCRSADEARAEPDENYRKITVASRDDRAAAEQANRAGLAHLDAGELEQAQQAFERAIELDRDFGPAYNHLGKVYYLKRDFYRAAHQFDRAGRLMPNHPAPFNNLGLTLAEAGRLDEAVDKFRKAVTLEPMNLGYQGNLARTLVQRGEQSAEVITLLKSVAANHEDLAWRVWASQELGRLGR